jgi:hypothetical protein
MLSERATRWVRDPMRLADDVELGFYPPGGGKRTCM